jgi:hypothetical protein
MGSSLATTAACCTKAVQVYRLYRLHRSRLGPAQRPVAQESAGDVNAPHFDQPCEWSQAGLQAVHHAHCGALRARQCEPLTRTQAHVTRVLRQKPSRDGSPQPARVPPTSPRHTLKSQPRVVTQMSHSTPLASSTNLCSAPRKPPAACVHGPSPPRGPPRSARGPASRCKPAHDTRKPVRSPRAATHSLATRVPARCRKARPCKGRVPPHLMMGTRASRMRVAGPRVTPPASSWSARWRSSPTQSSPLSASCGGGAAHTIAACCQPKQRLGVQRAEEEEGRSEACFGRALLVEGVCCCGLRVRARPGGCTHHGQHVALALGKARGQAGPPGLQPFDRSHARQREVEVGAGAVARADVAAVGHQHERGRGREGGGEQLLQSPDDLLAHMGVMRAWLAGLRRGTRRGAAAVRRARL